MAPNGMSEAPSNESKLRDYFVSQLGTLNQETVETILSMLESGEKIMKEESSSLSGEREELFQRLKAFPEGSVSSDERDALSAALERLTTAGTTVEEEVDPDIARILSFALATDVKKVMIRNAEKEKHQLRPELQELLQEVGDVVDGMWDVQQQRRWIANARKSVVQYPSHGEKGDEEENPPSQEPAAST
jgi:hypothetical protein